MTLQMRSPIVGLIVVGMAFWQWGCAVTRPTVAATPPQEIPGQLGAGSVVSASEPAKTELTAPSRGQGALRGALASAGTGVKVGIVPGLVVMAASYPLIVIPPLSAMVFGAGLALTAAGAVVGAGVGALGGALHGAVTAEPASREESAALRPALEDSASQETLRQRVVDVATDSEE